MNAQTLTKKEFGKKGNNEVGRLGNSRVGGLIHPFPTTTLSRLSPSSSHDMIETLANKFKVTVDDVSCVARALGLERLWTMSVKEVLQVLGGEQVG